MCTPCCDFDDTRAEQEHPGSFSTILRGIGMVGLIYNWSRRIIVVWRYTGRIVRVRLFLSIVHCVSKQDLGREKMTYLA